MTAHDWAPLLEGEVLMPDTDPDEIFLRGIRPAQLDQGEVGPQAFELSSADRETMQLSGARAALQTPAGLATERTCAFIGGVTIGEIESVGPMRVIDNHVLVSDAVGHSYIDASRTQAPSVPKFERRRVREALADIATVRGNLLTGA